MQAAPAEMARIMRLVQIKGVAVVVLCIAATMLIGVLTYEVVTLSPKIRETVANVNRGSLALADYAEAQTTEFQSDAYQKRIKQGFEVGRDASITIAKFNRTTIPRINQATDELTARLRDLRAPTVALTRSADSLSDFIAATNASVNNDLLPATTRTVSTMDRSVAAQSQKLGEAIDSINARIRDQRIDDFLTSLPKTGANVDAITANLATVTGDFAKAAAHAPEIAALWEQMMQTSKKYQKAILWARIVGLVGSLFPW